MKLAGGHDGTVCGIDTFTSSTLNHFSNKRGDVDLVAERLDALAFGISLALVTDEQPFKIFTAVHNDSFLCL